MNYTTTLQTCSNILTFSNINNLLFTKSFEDSNKALSLSFFEDLLHKNGFIFKMFSSWDIDILLHFTLSVH